MENQNNRKEALRRKIEQVIKSRETGLTNLSGKTIEEVLQEISIYHQELEFQNLELMRIQDDLQRSEKHYEELFSNAPIGYVIVDANSIIHSANAMFAEMFEQKPENLKSQNLNLFVHPDYQDRFYLLIKKVLKEKTKSQPVDPAS
jgi:PAS domain-containing protein